MASIRPLCRAAARAQLAARSTTTTTTTMAPTATLFQTTRITMPQSRLYSSEEAAPRVPPFLATLKGDLKTAMRSKDKPRLSVLRSVLPAVANAAKTANPIETQLQLVALLRRTRSQVMEAVAEAEAAKRPDLIDPELAQVQVLDEYIDACGVETVTKDQLQSVVAGVAADLGPEGSTMANIMKAIMAPGGPLEGKDFQKKDLAELVSKVVAKPSKTK